MANLRDRLKRIQELKKETPQKIHTQYEDIPDLTDNGWEPCGFKVYKREIKTPSPFKSIKSLPAALPIIIPDLQGESLPQIEDFLFFDLETTGLSGGAGTVAFLAAFGKLSSGGELRITQYLLLDYPGENDFIEKVKGELEREKAVIVSYNGKCFDSQIIKTRCLMNRITPPQYYHADLLHPSRRLWKNIIHDCSQASIETRLLGLDRSSDIPGSLAPEIWFEFLKTGRVDRLIGVCDHNKADISGLAAILSKIILIADSPLDDKHLYDVERIALYWRKYLWRQESPSQGNKLEKDGEKLLRLAAEKDNPRAVYVYIYEQTRKGNIDTALKFVDRGLKLFDEDTIWHEKLLRRKERLIKRKNVNY
ncbi:MAG: ribonuclease H-like domain-containing protein [Treponema sp.]|jgi:uncharacterized protein YprB with RNaseH-like and TPR domain|nr:ribonuclease H-like domain-containing protein [Treponema sp.]